MEEPVAAAPNDASTVEEVDLSSEWASLLDHAKEPAPPAESIAAEPAAAEVAATEPAPQVEEIELPDILFEAVQESEQPLSAPHAGEVHEPATEAVNAEPDAAPEPEFAVPVEPPPAEQEIVAELSELAEQPAVAPEEAAVEFPEVHAETLLPEEELTTLPVPEHSEVASEGPEKELETVQPALEAVVPEPEFELDQDFELVLDPEPVVPAHELLAEIPLHPAQEETAEATPSNELPAQEEPVAAKRRPSNGHHTFTSDEFLSDLALEIDQLGLGQFQKPEAVPDQEISLEPAPVAAHTETESGPLKEVFDEFRNELGEMGAEDEDLETHYNLGIAFREMGLLEEAIGEFQKVAKANDKGKAFRYAMQCCTLLGLAFMEKGQPSIAAIWYDRALLTPGIDSESKLALRYDLGVAQESAGDLEAALKSFSQVYAVNIDYRDVAERIASLQKPAA